MMHTRPSLCDRPYVCPCVSCENGLHHGRVCVCLCVCVCWCVCVTQAEQTLMGELGGLSRLSAESVKRLSRVESDYEVRAAARFLFLVLFSAVSSFFATALHCFLFC